MVISTLGRRVIVCRAFAHATFHNYFERSYVASFEECESSERHSYRMKESRGRATAGSFARSRRNVLFTTRYVTLLVNYVSLQPQWPRSETFSWGRFLRSTLITVARFFSRCSLRMRRDTGVDSRLWNDPLSLINIDGKPLQMCETARALLFVVQFYRHPERGGREYVSVERPSLIVRLP